MIPNKLPPNNNANLLRGIRGYMEAHPEIFDCDELAAIDAAIEALRQSQSLPAGAVAEIGELNGTKLIVGRNEEALALLPKGTKLYALQADAQASELMP